MHKDYLLDILTHKDETNYPRTDQQKHYELQIAMDIFKGLWPELEREIEAGRTETVDA